VNQWLKRILQQQGEDVLASLKMGGEKIEISTCCAKKTENGFEVKKNAGGLEIRLEGKTYPELNAAEWVMWLKNTGEKDTPELSEIWAADVKIPVEEKTKVAQAGINGDLCSEENFLPFRKNLPAGSFRRVVPVGGKSSNGEFPYFDLQTKEEGVIVAIGWSGQWLYELERTQDAIQLRVGLEDACFYLNPGEEVRLPRILFKGFQDDPVEGHNEYRRLIFRHYSPKKADGSPMQLPAALACFDRYTFRMNEWNTEEGQMEYAEKTAKISCLDTVWLDAAWMAGGFPNGVGNYGFRKGFPRGLRPVADEVHRRGLQFLVWFEIERVSHGTMLAEEHPEWVIRDPQGKPRPWTIPRQDEDVAPPAPRAVFNIGIPEAREFVTKRLIDFIRQQGIDVYRQDFTIEPLKFWRMKDEPGRRGLTEIYHIMGLYRFWDDLRKAFPDMMIDNCSGGGRRIDLETCMRSVPLWRSDTGCSPITEDTPSDMWNQNQSIGLSHYLVYHSVGTWNPNAYEFRSAATNGIGCDFDVFHPDFDFGEAEECLKEFDRLKKYWLGDFYPITPATLDDTAWSAFQLHCPESGNGVLMVFRRAHSPYETAKFAFRGVSAEKEYLLLISDEERKIRQETVSGEKLLTGYGVSLLKTRSSTSIEYRETGR